MYFASAASYAASPSLTPVSRSNASCQRACSSPCTANSEMKLTITTPPFFGTRASTSSGTLRGVGESARALECEKMTGASAMSSTSFIVSADTWEMSTSMPSRFISRTTSSPNFVRPPCRATSVAESAQSTVLKCVSVM